MKAMSFAVLVVLSLLACKRSSGESPEEKAKAAAEEAKEIERANKVLGTLASLADKVKTQPAPTSMSSPVLRGTRNGYANFDVLLADELAEPNDSPKVRIRLDQYFAECAGQVKKKLVYSTSCVTPYAVVLKPRVFKTAEVSGSTYTPGRIDADAYVFDMSNGALIGGGRVEAKTPEQFTPSSQNAEYELSEKLGEAAFDSIVEALGVKQS